MQILSHGHREPDPSAATDPEVLRLRSALGQFELGRFLLDNRGLNGYWTSYVLLFPDRGRQTNLSSDGTPLSELETWLLNRCPIILATQERFRIAQMVTQQQLRAGMSLASLPCGLMDDLLSLDYTNHEGLTSPASIWIPMPLVKWQIAAKLFANLWRQPLSIAMPGSWAV